MKKLLSFLLIISLFLVFKPNVIALDTACTQEERLKLRQTASLTTIKYDLMDYEYAVFFDVTISGFTKDMYAAVPDENYAFSYVEGTNTSREADFTPGKTYKLEFYATDGTKCPGEKILTKYLQIPPYNHYSKNKICEGYEDFELCKKHTNLYKSIKTEEDFVKRVQQYINSVKNNSADKKDNDDNKQVSFLEKTLVFLNKYYLYIFIPIIVVGTVSIIVIQVQKRRSIL
ncbi:MAG: hypothetical protein PHT75_02590 [Bacilli bacterium]|nr:hypothetical protein [Bacilli bacterium]MDD3304997.1 hypothetical protein [Bacilli bacterium]MDD4053877.1 hypothetical protein [Bacilli bacterium]MDD4411033.1 hypothetical protein [Bacilli bacterium]